MLSQTSTVCHCTPAWLHGHLDNLVVSGLAADRAAAAAACMRAPRLLCRMSRVAMLEVALAADAFGHDVRTAQLICQRQMGIRSVVERLLFVQRCGYGLLQHWDLNGCSRVDGDSQATGCVVHSFFVLFFRAADTCLLSHSALVWVSAACQATVSGRLGALC